MKLSKFHAKKLRFLRLSLPFFTTCRLGRLYDLLALLFCKCVGVCSLRDSVIASGMLYIRAICSVNYLNVTVFELMDDASCLFVETVFDEPDASVKVDFQRVCAAWK